MRRQARHLAPKKREHVTVPAPRQNPVAVNLTPVWPVSVAGSGYVTPSWDIFESESVTWDDSWLTADELKGVAA